MDLVSNLCIFTLNVSICNVLNLKCNFFSLEMLDRTEAPQVQEGYGISVAFACLIEVVRSVALTVGGPEYLRDQDYETSGMIHVHIVLRIFISSNIYFQKYFDYGISFDFLILRLVQSSTQSVFTLTLKKSKRKHIQSTEIMNPD